MKEIKEKIYKFESQKPGKTVAIFAGVHGDEKAGVWGLKKLKKEIGEILKQGIVYLVFANPKAIDQNVRFTEKNLNRCFDVGLRGKEYEVLRSKDLMDILDDCDALFDLHAYNEPYGEPKPFLICEKDCFDVVSNLDFEIVVSGLNETQKGATDGYMYDNGKIGICAEVGAIENPEEFIELSLLSAKKFLANLGLINMENGWENKTKKKFMNSYLMYTKKTEDFVFTKRFKTFDQVLEGEVIAIDGKKEIKAEKDSYILFPHDDFDVGVEAFILAE